MNIEELTYCPWSGFRHRLPKKPFVLLILLAAFLLTACSDDTADNKNRRTVTFEAQPCATGYDDVKDGSGVSTTRSEWVPPSPYVPFEQTFGEDGLFENQNNLVNKSIGVFFTQDEAEPMEGTFFYRNNSNVSKWNLSMNVDEGLAAVTYQVYGFIPREDAVSATITPYPNDKYSEGAELTINGLNTVTPSDVCVIIGAKDGSAENDDTGRNGDESDGKRVKAGKFAVATKAATTTSTTGSNFIFLLFDHLYSALRFRFTVDDVYNTLRTIRLRQLELTPFSVYNGTEVKVRAKYNATITLRQNDNNKSPIVSVSFEPDNRSAYANPVPIFDGDLPLSTTVPEQFMGTFVPGEHTYFKLRSTYDVYDKNVTAEHPNGNLIRQSCVAENVINLRAKFGWQLETTRGSCYTYTIKVAPTYLYVLSEPDLDNPTVVVN